MNSSSFPARNVHVDNKNFFTDDQGLLNFWKSKTLLKKQKKNIAREVKESELCIWEIFCLILIN